MVLWGTERLPAVVENANVLRTRVRYFSIPYGRKYEKYILESDASKPLHEQEVLLMDQRRYTAGKLRLLLTSR